MSNKWQGTPVPNSGYVENVYFNTNLSIEEVNNLLSKLTYKESSAGIFLSGLLEKPGVYAIAVMTDANKTYYGIIDLANNTNFYIGGDESVKSEMESMAGFWGWNLDITYPIVINEELPSTTVGNENNLLTSLFSTTPFVKVEDKPKYDWLRELFINEAKPALERHSGSKAPSYEETENEAGGITVTIGTAK